MFKFKNFFRRKNKGIVTSQTPAMKAVVFAEIVRIRVAKLTDVEIDDAIRNTRPNDKNSEVARALMILERRTRTISDLTRGNCRVPAMARRPNHESKDRKPEDYTQFELSVLGIYI